MSREPGQLIDLLQQMIDCCGALLEASRRKCSALAAMNLDLIHQATGQEAALTERMRRLNDSRRELVAALTGEPPAASTADARQDASLARLVDSLKEPERTRVSVLRRELAEVMKHLQSVNITNSIVSRRSLRHFRELLGVISGSGPFDSRYDRRGRIAGGFAASGLVNSVG